MLSLTAASIPIADGHSSLSPKPAQRHRSDFAQRVFDLIVGSIMLLFAMPVILLALLAVRLTSRGPVIYTQTRLGRFGKPFVIYKIRSMTHNCEKVSGVQWASKRDARVTPVGRILRRTHIDELPQLINILRGDMSLVGPRPERPEIITALEPAIPQYRERLAVRPGLTGLAQVQLPPDVDLDGVKRKLKYDLRYIAIGSASMDARLVVATALNIAYVPAGFTRFILAIPGPSQVESERSANLSLSPEAPGIETAVHPVCATICEVSVDAASA